MDPHKFPLRLKLLNISRTSEGVEVDASVTDAAGVSVRHVSLTVGSKRTAAELCGILQHQVDTIAKDLHKRGGASLGEAATAEEQSLSFEQLKGMEFIGSIAT